MNKQLSALLLSASLLGAPLATSALASPPATGYQVALFGHHAQAGHKKHHRLRNAALAVGGALAVRHMVRKHRARHGQ